MIVAGLTSKLRKAAEQAKAAQNALVNAIPALVWSALPDGSRDFHSQRLLEFTVRSARRIGWGRLDCRLSSGGPREHHGQVARVKCNR